MIYLSKLLLNPRSRNVQRDQRNPYEMHRTLSKAFGEGKETLQQARCLFRLEEQSSDGTCVLVQSRVEPEWQRLAQNADYLLGSPQIKAIDLNIPVGSRLAFRLRANPTVFQDGKRNPLKEEDAQLQWLIRKGTVHGFRPGMAQVTHVDVVRFCTAAERAVTMQAVQYDGVLTVTDAQEFMAALEGGIGSGKGFGFGLLSIARAFV
ncbi:MAG: CRISPR-associated protein Cse3 family [Chthonomonadaceae bacterium]|nr:CRISPR-associated protein Cse3 family [Chthonomonadaceae bacterium]